MSKRVLINNIYTYLFKKQRQTYMQEPRLVHTIENLYDRYIKIYQQKFCPG